MQAVIKKIKEIQKISGAEWDELVDAIHSLDRGHSHDGVGSRKINFPPVQYMIGSSPEGLEIHADGGKRITYSYGSIVSLEFVPSERADCIFEACLSTSAGVARARIYDLTACKIDDDSIIEAFSNEKKLYRRFVMLNPNHEYEIQILTDIGNRTTVYSAAILLQS